MDQLGLCEKRCPNSHSQTKGPHGNVRQPGQPALLTAEPHLWKETTVVARPAIRMTFLWGRPGKAEALLFQLQVR